MNPIPKSLLNHIRIILEHVSGEIGDTRGFKNAGYVRFHVKIFLQLVVENRGLQGIAAQFEEVVMNTNFVDFKDFLPALRQIFLKRVARFHVGFG